jgi:hypothetical protein
MLATEVDPKQFGFLGLVPGNQEPHFCSRPVRVSDISGRVWRVALAPDL